MILLLCPKCKNKMKYQSRGISLKSKKKRCVYCGRTFTVKNAIIKQL